MKNWEMWKNERKKNVKKSMQVYVKDERKMKRKDMMKIRYKIYNNEIGI
jgi:hypothetical protein